MAVPFEFARENVALAPLTWYKIGGPARLALYPRSTDEAREAFAWMAGQRAPKLILGNGSNVLIADEGFDGIVLITTGLDRIESQGEGAYVVEAGVNLDRLVGEIMLANNYEGVGPLTGIPGSVGGALYMNAGAGTGSVCQFVRWVELCESAAESPANLRRIAMTPALYDYRQQAFCPSGSLILRAAFQFERSAEDQRAIYDRYMQRRLDNHPQGDCCGSVFKNPPGDHAGRLIEACGLKGTRCGGAVISPRHANFIMNEGGATCRDVLSLIALCKRSVSERFGIELHEEVRVICSK